jgi:hypothetical protein
VPTVVRVAGEIEITSPFISTFFEALKDDSCMQRFHLILRRFVLSISLIAVLSIVFSLGGGGGTRGEKLTFADFLVINEISCCIALRNFCCLHRAGRIHPSCFRDGTACQLL